MTKKRSLRKATGKTKVSKERVSTTLKSSKKKNSKKLAKRKATKKSTKKTNKIKSSPKKPSNRFAKTVTERVNIVDHKPLDFNMGRNQKPHKDEQPDYSNYKENKLTLIIEVSIPVILGIALIYIVWHYLQNVMYAGITTGVVVLGLILIVPGLLRHPNSIPLHQLSKKEEDKLIDSVVEAQNSIQKEP